MGCNNALLTRFRVRIREENSGLGGQRFDPLGLIIHKNITRITGLTLGDMGEISLTEYNKTVRIPDQRRQIPPLGLQLRVDGSSGALRTQNFFEQWWEDRDRKTCTIIVDITSRSWSLLYQFEFIGCAIQSFSTDDQDLASPQIGYLNMGFLPYDVQYKRDFADFVAASAVSAAIG